MSDTPNANAIVIDLNSSNHSQPIAKGSQLIQRAAYENLRIKLIEDLKQAQDFAKDAPKPRSPDDARYPLGSGLTYFIDGTRGAGKSTFLRYAYQNLDHQDMGETQGQENDAKRSGAVKVLPLMYLDPSRIESSEHVLLHILKRLTQLAKACGDRETFGQGDQERFRGSLHELAGGLHVLSGSKLGLNDLDAELFLDHGLERAADSQRLRGKLHSVIESVCKMYRVDAVVLAIDDADTKAQLAMEVLECLRKYLDTPQVVALVTGDLEMYSLLVQNHFQKDFASEDKGLNADRRKQQDRMVEHLEDQYLLKLFPIQRRVQLKTLYTLSEKSDKPTYSVITLGGDSKPLHDAVDQIATQGLKLRSKADITLFREHVLKLPVRSVLQLLSTYYKLSKSESARPTDAASEALRATALSSLYRHDVDVESIAEGDLHATIEAAFNLSVRDGEPDTAVYLRPQTRDASLRSAYVSLAADVARLCENNPAHAIKYMLVTAGSSNIFHLVAKKIGVASAGAEDALELQKKIKQYLSVGRTDNALNWSWHATAALIGASTSNVWELRQGIVGVRTSRKNGAKTFDDQLNKASSDLASKRAYPAIAFSQSGVKRSNNTQRYLSIFNTLGLIANLLELDVSSDPNPTRSISDSISDQLNKVRNTPTVSWPNWSDLISSEDEDEDEDESKKKLDDNNKAEEKDESTNPSEGAKEPGFDLLVNHVEQWLDICEPLKKQFHPSAVLLGKIWNRLYFSLDNISSQMRSSDTHNNERCVKTMELFAWGLINACLVEEVDYHYRKDDSAQGVIDRSNPRSSGEPVIKKFIRIAESKVIDVTPTIAPLTFMIASCPLLLGLIKEGKKGQAKDLTMKAFIDTLNTKLACIGTEPALDDHVTCDQSTWDVLGETAVSQTGISQTSKNSGSKKARGTKAGESPN